MNKKQQERNNTNNPPSEFQSQKLHEKSQAAQCVFSNKRDVYSPILFKNTPLPTQSMDEKGNILDVNPAWLKLLGYSIESARNKNFTEFLDEDSQESFAKCHREFMDNGSVHSKEMVLIDANGKKHIVAFDGQIIKSSKGGHKKSCCRFRDITEIREADKVRKKVNREYEQIFNSAVPILVIGLDFLVKRANYSFLGLHQATRDWALGRPCYEFWPSDKCHTEKCTLRRILNGETFVELEKPLTDFLGESRRQLVITSPYKNDKGELDGIIQSCFDITDRKKVEDELQKRERLLHTVTQNLPKTYLIIVERDLTISYSGGREFDKQQLNMGKFVGMYLEELFGEKYQTIMPYCEKAFSGEECSFEMRFNAQDQLYKVVPLLSETGEIERILAVVENVTERNIAEREKNQSDIRLRHLFENMSGGVAIYDSIDDGRDFVFKDFNRAAERHTGFSRKEVIGKRVTEMFPGVNNFGLLETLKQVYKSGEPRRHPTRSYEDDRLSAWYDNYVYRLPDGEVVAIFEDITARRQAEQQQRRLISLVENSNEFIGIASLDGHVQFVNDAGLRMTGLKDQQEAQTKTIFDFVDKDKRSAIADDTLPRVIKDGYATGEGTMLHFPSGKSFDIGFRVIVLKSEEGNQANFFAILANDISQRKKDEKDKELLESQLRQSQKMEAIGRLAGGIAHDFNNLLTSIIGNISLAEMDLIEGDPLEDVLGEINGAAKRAANLTHQLLAFSRKQVIEPKVINLNDLIDGMQKMLVRIIGEDIRFQTFLQQELGRIKADPGQIEQIILNLAVNARDAMLGGGLLSMKTSNVSLDREFLGQRVTIKPGEYVLFSVSDTGHGIDESTAQRIFDPFFTTKVKDKGTGLGLSTVYGIVKQHEGYIDLKSEPGKGALFQVYLPRVKEKAQSIKRKSMVGDMPGGSETVLIVEDEQIVRDIAIKILARLGYTVLHTDSGSKALSMIERNSGDIDLLITDIVMPDIDGKELAVEVSKLKLEIKVLYTSGYTKNEIAPHGVLDNGFNFLAKPYTPQALAVMLRRVLDEKG